MVMALEFIRDGDGWVVVEYTVLQFISRFLSVEWNDLILLNQLKCAVQQNCIRWTESTHYTTYLQRHFAWT